MAEFALVLLTQSARLYRLGSGPAEHVATAEADDDVAAWVVQHVEAGANCALVSDSMDESYVQSNVPPMWMPATRQQIMRRRLAQQLRDTPYRVAVLAPTGSWRPPTRVSLIGMGQHERIGEWLGALAARQIKVKGLWPMSALIARAINHKVPKGKRPAPSGASTEPARIRPTLALVATPAGLRQVLLRGRIPLFSRLVPHANEDLSAASVLTEARRTVQYLISQDWLSSADQPVATQVWLASEHAKALAELSNDLNFDVQSIEVVTDAYASLLPLLVSASAQLQFLPALSRTSWRVAQIGKAANLVGLAALVLSGLWSADVLWQTWGQRQQLQAQTTRTAVLLEQSREEVLRAKGDLSQAGLAVATVQAWQQTLAAQPDQWVAMQHLAGALQAVTGVVVQTIRWELPRMQAQTAGGAVPAVVRLACPQMSVKGTLPAAPAKAPEPAKPVLALLSLTASLPSELSQRQALQLQNQLLSGLNANGWTAFVSQSTVNLDATQAQRGKLGEQKARSVDYCLQRVES
jgi:hypothetical protein